MMHPAKLSLSASVLALLFLSAAPAAAQPAAKRGPSTPEERAKAVELVRVLETAPASPEAAQARQWLDAWLGEIPDLTVKYCLSLFGATKEAVTKELPRDLAMQHAYSAPHTSSRTPARVPARPRPSSPASRARSRAYKALKAEKSPDTYPLLEALLEKDRAGTLDVHVRTFGRNCR